MLKVIFSQKKRLDFPPYARFILSGILLFAFLATSAWGAPVKNKLTIVNESGEDVSVRMMGPRDWVVDIPAGDERTLLLPAGVYRYLVRYGTEQNYRFSRGKPFQIEQARVGFTEASLTLISAPAQGINDPRLIEDFNKPIGTAPGSTDPVEFITHKVRPGDTLPSITEWYSGQANAWPEVAKYNLDVDPYHLKPGTTIKIPSSLAVLNDTPPDSKPGSGPKPLRKRQRQPQATTPSAPQTPGANTGFGPK
ncbi:MAG TPA: LysM domain-containing protein [Thermodesulfobacteriota bacterium]|nr:LysM domain-containing protein [Thermodesulfobacteriota bacterium]